MVFCLGFRTSFLWLFILNLQFSVFPTYCFLHTVHVSKYKIFLLLQLKFLFSLNRVAPVEDLASSSFLRYPKEQRSQFDLLQGTTPNSSSGLNLALVSKRFRFGGCLVASRGLFFIDLWSLVDLTLLILLLMNWKSIAWFGLWVMTNGMMSGFSMLKSEEVSFSFADLIASSMSFSG